MSRWSVLAKKQKKQLMKSKRQCGCRGPGGIKFWICYHLETMASRQVLHRITSSQPMSNERFLRIHAQSSCLIRDTRCDYELMERIPFCRSPSLVSIKQIEESRHFFFYTHKSWGFLFLFNFLKWSILPLVIQFRAFLHSGFCIGIMFRSWPLFP